MRQDGYSHLETAAAMTLAIDDHWWRVRTVKITRVASDWFFHIVAIGPRTHTLFLRSDRPPDAGGTGLRLVSTVRQWLEQNDARPCAFLDLNAAQ